MLKGISPLFSPELLATIYRMGHGDEIILADAHFPGESLGVPVIRADGLEVADLLNAILPLFELDNYFDSIKSPPAKGVKSKPRNCFNRRLVTVHAWQGFKLDCIYSLPSIRYPDENFYLKVGGKLKDPASPNNSERIICRLGQKQRLVKNLAYSER